jgi:NHL repeat
MLFLTACTKSLNQDPNTSTSNSDSTGTVTPPKTYVVSTIAGSGNRGYADGDSSNAEFNNPQFVAIDLQGDLLVSDVANQVIRMISPAKKVTTWTSDSIANLSTTSNINPVFGNIFGLGVDSKNNLFLIDYGWVREFTSPTSSSVFAGELLVGYTDGIGTAADFQTLMHMTIDRQDNIFVTDYDMTGVWQVRKITPAGAVSTVQKQDNTNVNSNMVSSSSWFDYAVAVDSAGNIYVGANTVIKKITPQGAVSIVAGGNFGNTPDGQGTQVGFSGITDMACDAAGNLIVVDGPSCSIRQVTPGGVVTTIAGSLGQGFADGSGAKAQFLDPMGVAVAKDGTIYVVDAGNNRIRKIAQQ